MKGIYRFGWDCGRQGELKGLFIAEKTDVEKYIGKTVYFGECLGKHSDIYGELEKEDINLITDDQDFIEKFIEIMGDGTVSGFNPIETIKQDIEDGVYD